jgi:hypothetical protein
LLSPGTVVGNRYRIDAFLEHGDLGDVYLAGDLVTQIPVTVKVLRQELAQDATFRRQFEQDAKALNGLDHPGIVRFYGFAQQGGLAFTVSEYVPGETLRRRLIDARGPLPTAEAGQILEQVAEAVGYAHRQGIIHGGLQPGNIILDNGAAMVEDFGVLPALEGAAPETISAGNPAYMSPEQFGGEANAQSDVYSLGVILYEMVTGQLPFRGSSGVGNTVRERLADEHLRALPPNPTDLNPKLPATASAVILRALDKQPDARWPDTVAFATAWNRSLSGAQTPKAAPTPVPVADAHATWGPAAGAAAAAMAAPFTTGSLPRREPRRLRRWALGGLILALTALLVGMLARLAIDRFTATNMQAAWAAGNFATAAPGSARATAPLAGAGTAVPGAGPFVITTEATDVRSGPSEDYRVVTTLAPGTALPITGRDSSGTWWQICCVDGGPGWLLASGVTTDGQAQNIPVVAGPAGQTPAPTGSGAAVKPPSPTPAPASPTQAPPTARPPALVQIQPGATPLPPTATPMPPTATPAPPSPTAVPPSPTSVPATSAAQSATCPNPSGGAFAELPPAGTLALGCPTTSTLATHYSHESFQRGAMIYRYDLSTIYVLYNDGTWDAYPDTYVDGQPWQLRDYQAPAGLSQPIKGFDRVWERPGVRAKLGWATSGEEGLIPGQVEDFQRGTALWLNKPGYMVRYFVLLADGRWARY